MFSLKNAGSVIKNPSKLSICRAITTSPICLLLALFPVIPKTAKDSLGKAYLSSVKIF